MNMHLASIPGFDVARFLAANPLWAAEIQQAAEGNLGALVAALLKNAQLAA